MFVRFVVAERDARTDQKKGVFTALYALERAGMLADHEVIWFHETERWFNTELREPGRLTRSKRPEAAKKSVTWLKATATEHVSRMRDLARLLLHKDIVVEELLTDKPGYIVYEDEFQVAAVPFGRETFS
jgi:hypothetical protein